jgi:hypothetical protein
MDNAAKQGYNVILSTPWYLNYISYGKYDTNTSVMNLEFFKYYEIEPIYCHGYGPEHRLLLNDCGVMQVSINLKMHNFD